MNVPFDAAFWKNIAKPTLTQFFENYVVTEILTEHIWRGLALFDTQTLLTDNSLLAEPDSDDTDPVPGSNDMMETHLADDSFGQPRETPSAECMDAEELSLQNSVLHFAVDNIQDEEEVVSDFVSPLGWYQCKMCTNEL